MFQVQCRLFYKAGSV